jgi:hypothetical protein
MSNKFIKFLAFIGFCQLFFGCQKPQDFELRTGNTILSLSVVYVNDKTQTIYSPVSQDYTQSEIQVKVPIVTGYTLSQMRVNISVPASSTITPAFKGTMDLSKPYRFSVTAENGDERKYLLAVYN